MFTRGTDPEFFIRDVQGKFVNAEKMFPGTKDSPFMLKSGAGLQTDNVAVEFASPVAENSEDLVDKLRATFKDLLPMIPKNHFLDLSPSAYFDREELQTEQSQLFGCSASYDAWALCENIPPDASDTTLRSIGGHIHIGSTGKEYPFLLDPFGAIDVVRMCDILHGIVSLELDNSAASVERRRLYGKAGEHRPTEYGVEYRTLSAFWLKSPDLVLLIDSLTTDALENVSKDMHSKAIEDVGGQETIINTINKGDVATARNIIREKLPTYMSKRTLELLNKCRDKVEEYEFIKEWQL